MAQSEWLDLQGVAAHTGLEYTTVRGYHTLATRRRRAHASRPGDLPKPDDHFGQSPAWKISTIDAWLATRPGQGAGGGRPPKHKD